MPENNNELSQFVDVLREAMHKKMISMVKVGSVIEAFHDGIFKLSEVVAIHKGNVICCEYHNDGSVCRYYHWIPNTHWFKYKIDGFFV